MAGNAVASFIVNVYPGGLDQMLRSQILRGQLFISPNNGTAGVPTAPTQITGWSITTNVLTLTANNTLTAGGGQTLVVQGFNGAFTFLNGSYTTTSATATTIVVPLTHANGSGSQLGLATVQGTYTTGGIPVSFTFYNQAGVPIQAENLSAAPLLEWLEAQTLQGSALNYKLNTVGTSPLLWIASGITQATDAAGVPVDAIGFRAEFARGY